MVLEAQRQLPEAQRAQLQMRHGTELEKAGLLVPPQPTAAGTAIELKLEIAVNLAALPELVALRNRLAGKNEAALSGFGDFARAILLQSQLQNAPQNALQIELLSALQNAPQSAPQSALHAAGLLHALCHCVTRVGGGHGLPWSSGFWSAARARLSLNPL